MFSCIVLGRAQKNAKHGADDKAKNLMEAMHEKMSLRETTRPHLFKSIRDVFNVDEKSHVGHMKAVKQSVLDGTSKWSAKLAITGKRRETRRESDSVHVLVQ